MPASPSLPLPPKPPIPAPHFLALDGLRGLAALLIVLYHRMGWSDGYLRLDHAYLAVDFFFMLSGFVIGFAYEEKFAAGMGFGRFMAIRIIRLGPLVLLGGVISVAYFVFHSRAQGTGLSPADYLAMACALVALPTPVAIPFDAATAFPLNGPSWSLCFEVAVNAMFALAIPWLGKRMLVAALVVCFAWLATLSITRDTLAYLGLLYGNFWSGIPRALFPFLFGVLLHRLHAGGVLPRIRLPLWLPAAILVLTFLPIPLLAGHVVFELACVAVLYPLVIVMAASHEPRGRTAKVLALAGQLSFPVYILHIPIYRWLGLPIDQGSPGILLLFVSVIVVLSYVALKFMDEPLRRLLRRHYLKE